MQLYRRISRGVVGGELRVERGFFLFFGRFRGMGGLFLCEWGGGGEEGLVKLFIRTYSSFRSFGRGCGFCVVFGHGDAFNRSTKLLRI